MNRSMVVNEVCLSIGPMGAGDGELLPGRIRLPVTSRKHEGLSAGPGLDRVPIRPDLDRPDLVGAEDGGPGAPESPQRLRRGVMVAVPPPHTDHRHLRLELREPLRTAGPRTPMV